VKRLLCDRPEGWFGVEPQGMPGTQEVAALDPGQRKGQSKLRCTFSRALSNRLSPILPMPVLSAPPSPCRTPLQRLVLGAFPATAIFKTPLPHARNVPEERRCNSRRRRVSLRRRSLGVPPCVSPTSSGGHTFHKGVRITFDWTEGTEGICTRAATDFNTS